MAEINLEKRILRLEEIAHAPQNYRTRCLEMEKKVAELTDKIHNLENYISLNFQIKN